MKDLDERRDDLHTTGLHEVVELACGIARRITRRQASFDPEVLCGNLKDSMALAVHAADIRIALHPSQIQTLQKELPNLKLTWPQLKHVELVEDAHDRPRRRPHFHTAWTGRRPDRNAIGSHRPGTHSRSRLASAGAGGESVKHLAGQMELVESSLTYRVVGQVQAIGGLTIEASGLALPVGSLCKVTGFGGQPSVAEVIGFQQDRTLLMSLGSTSGISRGDRVENTTSSASINCTSRMLGRVLDGFGRPIDGKQPLPVGERRRIDAKAAAPLKRRQIDTPIATSVRAIDALHTCGQGQRMGIFSGPGVGKTMLMAQIARHTSADVSVVCLVGERGREVQEFLYKSLTEEGLKRCVVIVSTSDEAPLLRVRSGRDRLHHCRIFRDQGKNVLLLVDSLTRLCQAQRQIGLAAREPPATKGFPPASSDYCPKFSNAPAIPRRSITGFYTVLVEGDDFNEPFPTP